MSTWIWKHHRNTSSQSTSPVNSAINTKYCCLSLTPCHNASITLPHHELPPSTTNPLHPMALAGKHCAIVGATGIIGSHIAQAFARRGAVLSLLGRSVLESRPRLEPLLAPYLPPPSSLSPDTDQGRSNNKIPSEHRYIRLDVSQRESIKDIFAGRSQNNVSSFRLLIFSNMVLSKAIVNELTDRLTQRTKMSWLDPLIFSSTVPAFLRPPFLREHQSKN